MDKKLANGRLNGNDFATTASISANKIITKKARARPCERARAKWRNGSEWGCAARLGGRLNREMLINELIKGKGK